MHDIYDNSLVRILHKEGIEINAHHNMGHSTNFKNCDLSHHSINPTGICKFPDRGTHISIFIWRLKMSNQNTSVQTKTFVGTDFPQLLDEVSGQWISLPPQFQIQGFDKPTANVPVIHQDYVFRKGLFRDVCNFLRRPYGHAMWLAGPTGSGKTSVITELAARLNWPVYSITCTGRMEFDDLVGRPMVVKKEGESTPSVRFIYGPLARAMKQGGILILNEVDLCDPAQLSGLNDILEGRPLSIPQNGGEVIQPHPMFRVVATANSRGSGDSSGQYAGIQIQNVAALDRYRVLEVGYLPQAVEKSLLGKLFSEQIPAGITDAMASVAERVRALFIEGQLSAPMSTRCLCFWANLLLDYQGAPNALKESLKLCFTNRLTEPERVSVFTICQQIFGGDSDWLDA